MERTLAIVPLTEDAFEAARLIDAEASPLASVLDPGEAMAPAAFRDAVVTAALEREHVAGVLFATRWGGGGVMIT